MQKKQNYYETHVRINLISSTFASRLDNRRRHQLFLHTDTKEI